ASQVLAQFNRGAVCTEAVNEIGRVEHTLVFAPPANNDKRHFGFQKLAQRPAEASLTGIPIARTHGGMRSFLATWAVHWRPESRRQSDSGIFRRGRARQSRREACPGHRGATSASGGKAINLSLRRRNGW